MGLLVLLAIVAVVAFWGIGIYNRLIGLKNQVANGWRQIDVQLKRRHDLIPNLVNTVKGAMEFERDTLTRVMEARAKAVAASTPAAAGAAEGELTQALGRLFALAENLFGDCLTINITGCGRLRAHQFSKIRIADRDDQR